MHEKKSFVKYPLLPLRDMVLFPRSVSSLYVGRDRSMEAVRLAMDGNRLLAVFTQQKTDTVLPAREDLFAIGTVVEILQLLKMPDGTFKILVEGLHSVELAEIEEQETFASALVSPVTVELPKEGSREAEIAARSLEKLQTAFETFNKDNSTVAPEFIAELNQKKDPLHITDSIAHLLPISFQQKQNILETLQLTERIEKVKTSLEGQVELQQLENRIQEKVRSQMDKMQRHFYLNEQMKVIRDEMSEGEPDEFDAYRQKIEDRNLPDEVKSRAETELKRLEKMPPLSAESTVVRNYLDWILDLPWGGHADDLTIDAADMQVAAEILEESHYSLEKIKDRILEFIAVRQLRPNSPGPVLCLVGPPGVGKTSLAKSLAKCLGRTFARISLGGVRDEAEIRGHRRTYIGALPGRIISTMKKAGTVNPVILLDEIDKMSSDYRGNPSAALLEVLDPEQNSEFTDHYMELPYDLSQVLFLCTANVVHSIPEPLQDRLEIVRLSGYTEMEKIQIARRYLIARQMENTGTKELKIDFNNKSIARIIRGYTREAGVRELDRQIGRITRRIAREFLESRLAGKEITEYELDKTSIEKYLGVPQFRINVREKEATVGQVHGLAWTSAGGDIMNIEAALAHGKGKLILTGNLGDVMKESANTALGFVRSMGHRLNLSDDFFDRTDIFLHVPEGAIPKDGPSAGLAMALTLISAITQQPVPGNFALTGEITLRGLALPIGGLKEKSLAAYRGGITDIICPRDNRKDLDEIPANVREHLRFHFVEHMRNVLQLALVNGEELLRDKPGQVPFYSPHLNRPGVEINKPS
ncbi:MAG: endopeptidase La [Leptospiraceae bacterium]|nr:endopeptidase La [Leptospiraceae bacterium]